MSETRALDDKQRCCGIKPLVYTRPPHFFCCRCDRAYSLETGEQIRNWAYEKGPGGDFRRVAPEKKP